MGQRSRQHMYRKYVFDEVCASGKSGITRGDLIKRLSSKVSNHQVQEALDYLVINRRIVKLEVLRYAVI